MRIPEAVRRPRARLADAMGSDAWELAGRAARAANVEIRALEDLDDAGPILAVMIATWGPHQLLPRELIRALQGSGNLPYGAFRDGGMIGYVLGFLGDDPVDGLHVHSHMLAVVPNLRHAGVGYALKLAQRAAALGAGAHVVRWTFDPMQARNAHFNVNKLGTTADRFHRHYYGDMTDELNRGERTDRLEARWDLDRLPVARPGVPGPESDVVRNRSGRPERVGDPEPGDGRFRVETVRDYPALRASDPGLASAWRDAVADALEACIRLGMVVAAFDSDPTAPAYVLAMPDANRDRPDAIAARNA
jgi:predicted GNAT superfamily acetyltransferase